MFTLQGLSVLIIAGSFFMLLKTQDKRWLYPLVIAGVLCIWTPWVKTPAPVQHHSSFNSPVETVPERVTVERETLEQKQQKLIEKSKGNN